MAESKKTVRTRFAPSPTGLLHIGGARTALFNYLWARRSGGEFLLRFEDTDRERSSASFEEPILEDLRWLGIWPDGDIIRQSSRSDRYGEILDQLKRTGIAYPCFCAEQSSGDERRAPYSGACRALSDDERTRRLEAGEPHCWRFHAGEGLFCFTDRLRGEMSVQLASVGDFVIARTDGSYIYLFAVVVDDHDSEITHVIRGEEHLSNVPKQELIYRALGWDVPEWVHIPMILDSERHKLSKRSGAISVSSYREDGWSPRAIASYIATLSWSGAPADRLLTPDELSETFELDDVALVSPVHDQERMRHFGKLALGGIPVQELCKLISVTDELVGSDSDRFALIEELRPSCAALSELERAIHNILGCNECVSESVLFPDWLYLLGDKLAALPSERWASQNIKDELKIFQKDHALKGRELFHTLRVALTGAEQGAPLPLIIACLGRERLSERLSLKRS